MNVEILGINRSDQSNYNESVTSGSTLPWLQDTVEAGQWASWEAVWRDVRIVNSRLEPAAVYNLTSNDLTNPENRTALMQLFGDAIQLAEEDADGDGLRDDWESVYLGDLASSSGADDDPDGDGFSNFAEFAFGSDPLSSTSVPQTTLWIDTDGEGTHYPGLAFRRRAGNGVRYIWQQSSDLVVWTDADEAGLPFQIHPVYDGRGTFMALYRSPAAFEAERTGYFRIVAQPDS